MRPAKSSVESWTAMMGTQSDVAGREKWWVENPRASMVEGVEVIEIAKVVEVVQLELWEWPGGGAGI